MSDILLRIEGALAHILHGRTPMNVPPGEHDPDMVLRNASEEIVALRARVAELEAQVAQAKAPWAGLSAEGASIVAGISSGATPPFTFTIRVLHADLIRIMAAHAALAKDLDQLRKAIDPDTVIEACVPGGDICDPQAIADRLREYLAAAAGTNTPEVTP